MKAIIMAGGLGTRLRPLTCNIPKPMMPIMGKPVIEYTIDLLKKNGITDIGITLQYLPDEVINYCGDGKKFGVNLSYFVEEIPLGTAGSVKNAEKFLDETFIVISGDGLTDIKIKDAISYHKKNKAIATLVLKEVPVPLEYGVVVTDKDGKVTGFLEKPSWGEVFSDKVNTGIYVLEPEIFNYYGKDQKFDFSSDLFPILLNNKKPVYGYVADGYWCDIGNIEQYMKCHYDILKGIVNIDIKGQKYMNGIWVNENSEISPSVKLVPPVYIGNNCKLYENSQVGPFTVLGKNNIISKGANIKRSIIFDNCYIGNSSEVRGAVLCKKVQLESKTSVFEGVSIGDDTIIGQKSTIKPNVSIWPNKLVESSTTVRSNIIWGGKFSKSLFGKKGVSGEVNVDVTPEFVSKLGSAYGSLLKPGSKIAISCSDDGAAQMFKYSLATGLMSMGAKVYDLKRLTASMARQAAVFFGVQGAIHVAVSKDNLQRVNILFFDKNGIDIDKGMERKIQNCFLRDDFRRVKTDTLKTITHFSDTIEYYIRNLINGLNLEKVSNQKYKIVLSVRNQMFLSVVQRMLSELGIKFKLFDEYNNLLGLSREVVNSGANLGVYIFDEGERAVIIDEKGNVINNELYDALNMLVMLKQTKIKTLVVPVTASGISEEIANMCGAQFIRTKCSQKNILDAYFKNEKKLSKKEIVGAYLKFLDSVSMFMLTINMMAESNVTLSQIVCKIPKIFSKSLEIICPWNMKGKVMRNIIEKDSSRSIELIEGIKLNYDNAWALVLPDADEPLCRLYVESKDVKDVEDLSVYLSKRIQNIINVSKGEK